MMDELDGKVDLLILCGLLRHVRISFEKELEMRVKRSRGGHE